MAKVLNKVMGFLGLEEENSDIDEVEYLEEEDDEKTIMINKRQSSGHFPH